MSVVNIEPTKDSLPPYSTDPEVAPSLIDQIKVLGETAELQVALGAPLEVDEANLEREKQLLEAAIKNRKVENFQTPTTAFAAAAFLKTYGAQLAMDVATARAAITNKLMEIANCGDVKFELKALELLGKHSDIGIFTTRSEVTINYKDPADLENAIKERVKRLLNADVIDVSPLTANLDEELGIAGVDEVEEADETDEVAGEADDAT
jgi:hypothetical protein